MTTSRRLFLVPVSSFNFIKRSFAVRDCPTSCSCGGETRKGITFRCRSAKLTLSSIRWIPLDFGGGTSPRFFSPSNKYGQLKSLVMLGACANYCRDALASDLYRVV